MTDRILGQETIEPGMLVVFDPATRCYHFENQAGDRFLFVSGDGSTDNKKYVGLQTQASFKKEANRIARQNQPRLGIEYVYRSTDKPGTIRFRFIKWINPRTIRLIEP
jgi:hypothetical protein